MKKTIIISVIFLLFLSACGTKTEDDPSQKEITIKGDNSVNNKESNEPTEVDRFQKELAISTKNEKIVFIVSDLVELLQGDYHYDGLHRLLTINIDDQQFKMVDGIPVVEHNGLYLATDEIIVIVEGNDLFLPVVFLESALGLKVKIGRAHV